ARRECSATEPEQVNFIAGLIIGNEEPVGVVDVLLEASAKGTPGPTIEPVPGTHALVIVNDLGDWFVALRHPMYQTHDVARARCAIALLIRAIPRPVTTDDQPSHAAFLCIQTERRHTTAESAEPWAN